MENLSYADIEDAFEDKWNYDTDEGDRKREDEQEEGE